MNRAKYLIFAYGCFLLTRFCLADEESNEFFEIDTRKIYKDSFVKFGANIYNDMHDR